MYKQEYINCGSEVTMYTIQCNTITSTLYCKGSISLYMSWRLSRCCG